MFDAVIFVGTFKSRILWMFCLMHDHMELMSFECLCKLYLKDLQKVSASALSWVMSAWFQSFISRLGDFFVFIKSLLSVRTASWSLTPWTTEDFWIRSKLLVKNKSKIFFPLVGLSTVWESPKSLARSKNNWLIGVEY